MNWLNSWDAFLKVVESGSMAAAARRLDCTRAQISKQIADLERSFGVRLFERSTRRLRLTPSGEIFHQHALRAVEAVSQAELAVRNLGDSPHGILRISASITLGRLHIAPLLPKLVARYPELTCELVLTDTVVDLIDDRIDLALRLTSSPPQDTVVRKLAPVRRVICATPSYLATRGHPKTPQALAEHPCLAYMLGDESRIWGLLNNQGEEISVAVGSRIHFNSAECILDAALADHGIAMLPTYLCGPALRRGELVTLLDEYEPVSSIGRYLYACYTPSRIRLPKVRVLLDELDRYFTPVPPWEH